MKWFLVIFAVSALQVLQLEAGNHEYRDSFGNINKADRDRVDRGGSWGVSVNKDRGRGPQVRTEGQGNIHTSRDGNWRVDAHGHHEMGRGRKPDVGGGVSVNGRWRREADGLVLGDEVGQERLFRGKRQYSFTPNQQSSFMPNQQSWPKPPQQPNVPDRGSVGVSINVDKGRGPQIRTDVEKNIYKSRDGNWRVDGSGYHEAGRGRKPDYGVGVKVQGRFRRDVDEEAVEDQEEVAEEPQREKRSAPPVRAVTLLHKYKVPAKKIKPRVWRVRRDLEQLPTGDDVVCSEDGEDCLSRGKRSFAGGNSYPSPGSSSGKQDRGSWGVSVNKDKGRGPQVRTEGQGNIYTSPKGNVRVDGHGHHEMGKGRKPDYGGGVKVQGRWRREAEEESELMKEREESERVPREVDQDATTDDAEISTEEVAVREKRSFAGGSSYPSPGSYSGKQDRGSWGVSVNKDKGRGPQIRTEGQGNIYTSPKGNVRVDGHGHHEMGKGRKPDYGGGVKVHGRWRREADEEVQEIEEEEVSERVRREANPQKDPRGSVTMSLNHDKGRGPQVRTNGQYDFFRSRNGNWNAGVNGFHEAGRGRKPDYGAGVSVTGRFRREADDEEQTDDSEDLREVNQQEEDTVVRDRREANPQKDPKGSVSVSVNNDKGRGPQIRTDVQRNIYTSRDKSWKVDGSAYHEAGRGRKPDYGGGVTLSKRF